MTRLVKILMIIFFIIAFSSGIVHLVAAFFLSGPKAYITISIISFLFAYFINEEIMDHEIPKDEFDETF